LPDWRSGIAECVRALIVRCEDETIARAPA
jgi:hypothetical protein